MHDQAYVVTVLRRPCTNCCLALYDGATRNHTGSIHLQPDTSIVWGTVPLLRGLHCAAWLGGMPFTVVAFSLIEFRRSPKSLLDALMYSPELAHIRAGLENNGISPILESGAKMLVPPEDATTITEYFREHGIPLGERRMFWEDLHPRHLIVGMDVESEVLHAVHTTKGSGVNGGNGRGKVRVKQRQFVCLLSQRLQHRRGRSKLGTSCFLETCGSVLYKLLPYRMHWMRSISTRYGCCRLYMCDCP